MSYFKPNCALNKTVTSNWAQQWKYTVLCAAGGYNS